MKGAVALALVVSVAFAANATEPEGVMRVEPGTSLVPANHLKFYLHFPEPMERGDVFRFLRLVEVDGEGGEVGEVPEPFREVELWDETFTRFTLWFHPGRQKPGVNLNVEIGPILEERKSYRLEISERWVMESGRTLPGVRHHTFRAGAMDEEQPEPTAWTLETGADEIRIGTGETLDPESLKKRIEVVADGEEQALAIRIKPETGGFRISREGGWPSGAYSLVVDPRLEDLAGNSVARPFNLDLEKEEEEVTESTIIRFSIP